jgi:hypothetical protein
VSASAHSCPAWCTLPSQAHDSYGCIGDHVTVTDRDGHVLEAWPTMPPGTHPRVVLDLTDEYGLPLSAGDSFELCAEQLRELETKLRRLARRIGAPPRLIPVHSTPGDGTP